jgi:hypothetical protein
MKIKAALWMILLMLFSVPARANLIVPFAMATIPFYPVFLLIEAAIFWVFARHVYFIETTFRRIIGLVALANLISSIAGVFLRLNASSLIPAFILTLVIEFTILFPFYKNKCNYWELGLIVVLMNAVSYAIFAAIIF